MATEPLGGYLRSVGRRMNRSGTAEAVRRAERLVGQIFDVLRHFTGRMVVAYGGCCCSARWSEVI